MSDSDLKKTKATAERKAASESARRRQGGGKRANGASSAPAGTSRATSTQPPRQEPMLSPEEIIADYTIARRSREASLLGRKEVLTGKAKFGIFGDGKEVAQLAMARAFRPGDFRSGYYRDQTLLFALDMLSIREFFAQLYADTEPGRDPASAGRQMNSHFATRLVDEDGTWRSQTAQFNTSADISPTGSQMPRLVGLAYASRLYRELDELKGMSDYGKFSNNGEEIAFGTIGNASAAEGMFFEAVNAIGVLKSPAIISVWDDEYGISVTNEHQMTKGSISDVLSGLQRKEGDATGYDVYVVNGWDYPALLKCYRDAAEIARRDHVPALIHVVEMTQPQGHSSSGSHERYKTKERLSWEVEFDPIDKMKEWIIAEGIATPEELERIDQDAVEFVRGEQTAAWNEYLEPILADVDRLRATLETIAATSSGSTEILGIAEDLDRRRSSIYRLDLAKGITSALIAMRHDAPELREPLIRYKEEFDQANRERYSSHLFSETAMKSYDVEEIAPVYTDGSERLKGFEIVNRCFDAALARDPRIVAFGEDVGQLGDVDQGFAGLQTKYGPLRVSDTGIREVTIVGQAIGMAMRGLRPIAEIQYLDYLLYALQIMSDDLATVQYRTRGAQKAPVIIRTRGHRLEGIWHSGSPMAGIIHLVRGINVLVPRDMTRAAAFYNTMFKSDDPALIVEVLSGYRLREPLPENIDTITLPLGVPEVLREGRDVTIVTYGACCRFALEAATLLDGLDISIEVIDVQSLLPFDRHEMILQSLRKTNRILFLDEDVPGGTTAYMMQQVIEEQGGWRWLDADPRTLSANEHRPAYGSDGSFWSKPFTEHIVEDVYGMMSESDPKRFPALFTSGRRSRR